MVAGAPIDRLQRARDRAHGRLPHVQVRDLTHRTTVVYRTHFRSGRIDLSPSLPSIFDLSRYDIISLATQFLGIVLVEEAGFYYSHRLVDL